MNTSVKSRACFSLRCASLLAAGAFVLTAALRPDAASADAPTSAAVTTLYDFGVPDVNAPGWPIGSTPFGLAALPGGGLAALTQAGGTNGEGTIVQFGSGGTNPSALYTFGSSPSADSSLLAGAGGVLYQTDPVGGANSSGALNKLAPSGSLMPLYSFSAVDGSGNNADGSYPVGTLLQGSGGTLYGETQQGGSAGSGIVYKINADGTGFTVLHDFGSGTDGVYPSGGLIFGPDGFLYGVTVGGGSGDSGTIFKVSTTGSGYALLYQFSADPTLTANADGADPTAALTLGSDGLLYGETPDGGSGGSGAVFQIGADGSNFSVLYAFSATGTDPSNPNANSDGAIPSPAALVKDADGNFYGTTVSGGEAGQGTVFLITSGGVLFSTLYTFGPGSGTSPVLTTGSDGALYGLTSDGGANGFGSLFQVTLHRPATHVLWDNSSGRAAIWTYSAVTGTFRENDFGPYPGWTAQALADGPDSLTRVLWTNTSGAASFWSLSTRTGGFTQNTYGPYPSWTAKAVSAGPDNTTHVLWTNTNGAASIWNYSASDGTFTQNTYGPYPGWTAKAVADGPDDMTRVLWTNASGAASLWSLDPLAGVFTQLTFGPYPGWTAGALTVNVDNTTQVLWNKSNGVLACWNYSTGTGFLGENDFGPYPGATALALADGSDALAHILWTSTNGSASLWSLNTLTGTFTQNTYGPYSGWTAKALSAGQ